MVCFEFERQRQETQERLLLRLPFGKFFMCQSLASEKMLVSMTPSGPHRAFMVAHFFVG